MRFQLCGGAQPQDDQQSYMEVLGEDLREVSVARASSVTYTLVNSQQLANSNAGFLLTKP